MKNGDDVLQFISKVGEQNLNYRSFQTNSPSSGQSKWELINQVTQYKPQLPHFHAERTESEVPFNAVVLNDGASFAQSLNATGNSGSERASLSLSKERQFANLFKTSQQPTEAEKQTAKGDSLAAFLSRVGL